MQTAPFGEATVASGKNKGQARSISFATGIAAENANGLPVSKNGKGENVVSISFSPALPTVHVFESADEVRSIAAENFDTFVVDAANDRARSAVRSALTTEARKLSLPPQDLPGWINTVCQSITPAGLFVPAAAAATATKRGVKAELANLAQAAQNMSHEDLLAAIAALASK